MNTKQLFKNYKENQAAIILYQREIDLRRSEFMPNMVNVLSFTPVAHDNESEVEKTVIKIDEDEKIAEYKRRIKCAQMDIQTVDRLLDLVSDDVRKIITMYLIDGESCAEVAEKVGCCERDLYRKLRDALRRLDNLFD